MISGMLLQGVSEDCLTLQGIFQVNLAWPYSGRWNTAGSIVGVDFDEPNYFFYINLSTARWTFP